MYSGYHIKKKNDWMAIIIKVELTFAYYNYLNLMEVI